MLSGYITKTSISAFNSIMNERKMKKLHTCKWHCRVAFSLNFQNAVGFLFQRLQWSWNHNSICKSLQKRWTKMMAYYDVIVFMFVVNCSLADHKRGKEKYRQCAYIMTSIDVTFTLRTTKTKPFFIKDSIQQCIFWTAKAYSFIYFCFYPYNFPMYDECQTLTVWVDKTLLLNRVV